MTPLANYPAVTVSIYHVTFRACDPEHHELGDKPYVVAIRLVHNELTADCITTQSAVSHARIQASEEYDRDDIYVVNIEEVERI